MKLGFIVVFLVALHLGFGEEIDSIEMRYHHIDSDTRTYVACPGYRGHSHLYHHRGWTARIAGAHWIWGAQNNGHAMGCRFERRFYNYYGLDNAVLDVAADDTFRAYINNRYAYCTCNYGVGMITIKKDAMSKTTLM